jgi:hypothetical protein
MENEFIANTLVVYIERKIAENFNFDLIFDDFSSLNKHSLQF